MTAHGPTGGDAGAGRGEPDGLDLPDAAAEALLRARAAASAKGLRPGVRPPRRRRSEVGRDLRDGRDPTLLGESIDRLVTDRGWQVDLEVGSVMGRWPLIVGADLADHCVPVTFADGVLTVRAESTAWATQLRLLTSVLLGRISAEVGPDVVTELRVTGPASPSWSKGPRRVSDGRGPRDTYG